MNRRHKAPFGAEVERDGVRFRLWAPRLPRSHCGWRVIDPLTCRWKKRQTASLP